MKDENEAAIILFGHGARDPEWARPMQRARAFLLARAPHLRIELAFLELMEPALGEVIDRLVGDGLTHITVVPMFLAQGGHLKNDLPGLLAVTRAQYPWCEIRQARAVGEADEVLEAMADYALRCAAETGQRRD